VVIPATAAAPARSDGTPISLFFEQIAKVGLAGAFQSGWNIDCSNLGDTRRWLFPSAAHAELEVLGENQMAWLVRTLRLPAAESHTNVALALCVTLLGLMSVAILWQAQIIANQRDIIRFLESAKFGG